MALTDIDQGTKTKQKSWIKINDISNAIKQYIQDHPYQSAFHASNVVVFFAPGSVWGPVLGVLGFTDLGPAASSIASAVQAVIHPVVPRSMFAIFHAAQMGGYGMEIMNSVVRSGIEMITGGYWYSKYSRNGEADTRKGPSKQIKDDDKLQVKSMLTKIPPNSRDKEDHLDIDIIFVYLSIPILFHCYNLKKEI
ncbi:hypothetical protein I204_07020 [Kwoniella mangroviensis CBS 8886]|nr:hypothetical protein I204_07020 [Kwoniella mangroviensis CBS 8886]